MTRLPGGFLGVMALLGSAAAAQQTQPPISELLNAYNGREFTRAVAAGASIPDLENWRLIYPAAAEKWIRAEPREADRRRLVATALLIEVLRERFTSDALVFSPLIPALGWACDQLRQNPPSAGELAWHHAVIALAQRAGAQKVLTRPVLQPNPGGPVRAVFPCVDDPRRDSYLAYVQHRFPKDDRLKFQAALLQVQTLAAATPPGQLPPPSPPLRTGMTPASSSSTGGSVVPLPLEPTRISSPANDTRTAVRLVEPFTKNVDLGGEAEALIAGLYLSREEFGAAVDHTSAAAAIATDAGTRYLGLVLKGQALTGLREPLEARDAYLQALDTMPGGESAALLLAALNSTFQPSADMVGRAEEALVRAPRDEDPLRLSAFGDYRRWPIYVDRMRAALR